MLQRKLLYFKDFTVEKERVVEEREEEEEEEGYF